jgi:putative DNA primase/helicase
VAEDKYEPITRQADDVFAQIAAMADGAPQPPFLHGPSLAVSAVEEDVDDDECGPSSQPGDIERASPDALKLCAALDQSDTDNGMRLRTYFGGDLLVIAQEGITGGDYLAWSGTHWEIGSGAAAAMMLAQRLGGLIGAEADYITASPSEQRTIEAGERAQIDCKSLLASLPKSEREWTDEQRAKRDAHEVAISAAVDARNAIKKRQVARRRFGVSSKNKGRLEAMLACAAPHLRRSADLFNPDPHAFATATHTLRFVRELDLECPDPAAERWRWRLRAEAGHRREDMLTAIVPSRYDPSAKGERWNAFLERFMPAARYVEKRRTLQQYCGLGLTGIVVQHLMYHYGEGANGKSVFLETLVRVLGDAFAVSLPPETLIGSGERQGGQASPDIIRLFGKRMLRVPEIKPGAPLQEDLVKRITGGEKMTARAMYKGFVDFQNKAKPHMSGNGFPRIDGTDQGIWRRILVMHWTETIPEAERLEFEDVVSGLVDEAPAILNWMIEGALDYFNNGFYIAPDVRAATQEYRDEMDTVGQFARACIIDAPSEFVYGSDLYDAYVIWAKANQRTPVGLTKFGRVMKTRFRRDDTQPRRRYFDIRLQAIGPARHSDEPPHPADDAGAM